MTVDLRNVLIDMAEEAPPIRVPAGLFGKARRARRRRYLGVAVLVVVACLAGVIATWESASSPPTIVATAGGPTLPDRVSAPSRWTATVAQSPPGRAAVVFGGPAVPRVSPIPYDGDEDPVAVVGAERDSYRVFDRMDWIAEADGLLSPDGRYLVRDRQLLDLTTGRLRHKEDFYAWISGEDNGLVSAWSPDSTQVIVVGNAEVRLIDIDSGRVAWSAELVGVGEVTPELDLDPRLRAAMSRDGSVAVQVGERIKVFARGGRLVSTIEPVEAGTVRLAGPAAWAPDGRSIVVATRDRSCTDCRADWRLELRDAATGRAVPGLAFPAVRSGVLRLVTWRSVAEVVVVANGVDRDQVLSLRHQAATPTLVLDTPPGTSGLDVARDVAASGRSRAAGRPESGPLRTRYLVTGVAGGVCALVVLTTAILVWHVRRRRRR